MEIRLRKKSRQLSLTFSDNSQFDLGFEYLRVHSPSAEVRGHGEGQQILQLAKEAVLITAVEPVGHYAIRLIFDDGHDSGLYTWKYLHDLGVNHNARWSTYLDRLKAAGYARNTRENS